MFQALVPGHSDVLKTWSGLQLSLIHPSIVLLFLFYEAVSLRTAVAPPAHWVSTFTRKMKYFGKGGFKSLLFTTYKLVVMITISLTRILLTGASQG